MADGADFVFKIAILIMSVVAHELAHGYAANFLGDPTARLAGRLTANPVKHLEPFGSFILPTLSYLAGGFIFGWAKPVPYNPYNLRGRLSEVFVAVAGVLANFSLALIFGLIIRFGSGSFSENFLNIADYIVLINIVLGVFNLVPIPPLDGSKVLFNFLPVGMRNIEVFLERWGFVILIVFIFFFFDVLFPIISALHFLFTGYLLG